METTQQDVEENGSNKEVNSGPIRFLALFFMCILGFGSYFCYDNPGAIQTYFTEDMGLSTTEFTLLYAVYSWPNVVLCFIGGFLIDRVFGIRFGTVLYAFIVCIGQLVFAYGAYSNSFGLMLVGRFIFGIGGESLAVAQNNYAVVWFMGKELNTVFGLQLSFARVGSTVNLMVLGPIYDWVDQYFTGYRCLGVTLFIAFGTCLMSFLGAILLGMLKNKKEDIAREIARNNPDKEVVRLTDVKDFNITFWLITVICVAYYVAIFPLVALGKVFFERKFGLNDASASFANSILYVTSAVFSPVSGYIIDKTGRNVFWVSSSIFLTIVAHGMLAFTFVSPFITMSIIGIAYSMLAASLWPLVAYIIPAYQLGTAYGVAQAIQNLGLGVITTVTGMIVDSGGYFMLEVFFLAWLFLALLTAIIIWLHDGKGEGVLNMTNKQREAYDKARQDAEKQKLLSASGGEGSSQDLLQPQSDFQIRNRYLSRIGAHLPSHLAPVKGIPYRTLR